MRAIGLLFCITVLTAAEPLVSGLPPGRRPGPYSALVATGPHRGTPHCFICETADRPAVIVFARTPSDALGKLLVKVDEAVVKNEKSQLRAWATFLSDDQPALEPKLVEWGRKHGLANVPLGVFEDVNGPPSYRLHADADVTILLAVKQKVVANFAFRAGELTDEKIKAIMEAMVTLPRL